MIERRTNQYNIRGILWVCKHPHGPDVAVIAKASIDTYGVYAVTNGALYRRNTFRDYGAASSPRTPCHRPRERWIRP